MLISSIFASIEYKKFYHRRRTNIATLSTKGPNNWTIYRLNENTTNSEIAIKPITCDQFTGNFYLYLLSNRCSNSLLAKTWFLHETGFLRFTFFYILLRSSTVFQDTVFTFLFQRSVFSFRKIDYEQKNLDSRHKKSRQILWYTYLQTYIQKSHMSLASVTGNSRWRK